MLTRRHANRLLRPNTATLAAWGLSIVLALAGPRIIAAQEAPGKPPQTSPADAPANAPPTAPNAPQGPDAPPAAVAAPTIDNTAQNDQPAFYVRASLNREIHDYREGDVLGVQVECEIEAYLYVFYQLADGKVFQIFPNQVQQDNRIPAKQLVQVPGRDDLFRWVISAPFGRELVKVYATRERVDSLTGKGLTARRFNPVTTKQLKATEQELRQLDKSHWAEADVELVTHAKGDAPAPEGAKRFGVFFGVSQYTFNDDRINYAKRNKIEPGRANLNLNSCHLDAQDMSRTLTEIGGLTEARVFINAEVTRAAMEQAIYEWLPSVSKPGDTVIIDFSGHGSQIKDDNGDEADGLDETLVPSDVVDTAILDELKLKARNNQLDPALAARVAALSKLEEEAGPGGAEDALARATCISDDLFGHWLQRLAGRQVLVVLDSCHSGGFSTQEKGLADDAKVVESFDFLDGELARLKDIGQAEQALISACHADETATELLQNLSENEQGELLAQIKNGVLTGFLLECLRTSTGPVSVEAAYQHCVEQFPRYFDAINPILRKHNHKEVKPYTPLFINKCTRPVYMKL